MIDVTCAVIRNEDDRILVVQRGEATDHPYKWEFPGGKIDRKESDEECIIREIHEELSLDIVLLGRLPVVEHDYGHKKIRLIPFICDTIEDMPMLNEHIAFEWISPEELGKVDFSEADIAVAGSYLKSINYKAGSGETSSGQKFDSRDEDTGLQAMVNGMMSSKEAEWVATSAAENPEIFKKLISYSFSDDKKLAFHASWTLNKACEKYPELVNPYLPYIVESLSKMENESALRSFLRILSLTELNKLGLKHHGILADHCFSSLRSGFSAIAIKAYSMEILYRLALIYPELANELSATINLLQGEGSAGIVARGRMILRKLSETPKEKRSSQQ
jgi:8-oxo-dGTP diphosphatase